MSNSIAILDFGSQYSQLIARKLREANICCELFAWDAPEETIEALQPSGYILSGGPRSVYEPDAPFIQKFILEAGKPILGICYGMQALTDAFGGKVSPSADREYGKAEVKADRNNVLLPENQFQVWMSHGDRVTKLPEGFRSIGTSENSLYAAIADPRRKIFGLQFHPEVNHTIHGREILANFAIKVCGVTPSWTPESIIEKSIAAIRAQVGDQRVLAAVSGGVDSTVAAALVYKAIGDQLSSIFVDTGCLRKNEAKQVVSALSTLLGSEFVPVNASSEYFEALRGVTDPEQKRKIVGEKFIRIFERHAREIEKPSFLVQGTIYPDVVESSGKGREKAQKIKSHHNVGGLPEDMQFELVEPLRFLFKDEVRAVGEALGLPSEIVWRQPFPGPGLTVRCLGEVTPERIHRLQEADAILIEEISTAGYLGKGAGTSQAFAALLPVRSVGVMGDQRTYEEACAIRAVLTDDFMTAEWVKLPYDLLEKISTRIVNEVQGINRVVYDITNKPPATIEWE